MHHARAPPELGDQRRTGVLSDRGGPPWEQYQLHRHYRKGGGAQRIDQGRQHRPATPVWDNGSAGGFAGKRVCALLESRPLYPAIVCLVVCPWLLYVWFLGLPFTTVPSFPVQELSTVPAGKEWYRRYGLAFLPLPKRLRPTTILVRQQQPWWTSQTEPVPLTTSLEHTAVQLLDEVEEPWPHCEALDSVVEGGREEGSPFRSAPTVPGTAGKPWRVGRSNTTAHQPAEGYLSYNPHSQFNNQRSALQNAFAIARLLNRTLVVPRCYLGPDAATPWVPSNHSLPLNERLRILDESFTLNSSWPHERGNGVVVPCQALLNLDGPEVSYVDIDEFRRQFSSWPHAAQASVVAFRERQRHQYRFTDMSAAQLREDSKAVEQALAEGPFLELMPLRRLAALSPRDYPILHFNSLYGLNSLHLTLPLTTQVNSHVERTLVLRNPLIARAAHIIVERLGGRGSFVAGHFRSSGKFSPLAASLSMSLIRLLNSSAVEFSKEVTGASDFDDNMMDELDVESCVDAEGGNQTAELPESPATPRPCGSTPGVFPRSRRSEAIGIRADRNGPDRIHEHSAEKTATMGTIPRGDHSVPERTAVPSRNIRRRDFPAVTWGSGGSLAASKERVPSERRRPLIYLATDARRGNQELENLRRAFASGDGVLTLDDVVADIRPVLGGWWRHSANADRPSPEMETLRQLVFPDPFRPPEGVGLAGREGGRTSRKRRDDDDDPVELRLVRFAYPFVEQLVCANARYFVGTPGSTFSAYVVTEMAAAGSGGAAVMAE